MPSFNKKIRNILSELAFDLNIYSLFEFSNKVPVRVIIFHSTNDVEVFSELISHLSKSWDFIDPDHFFEFRDGKREFQKPSLLITFDDGFKNNLNIIPVLKKYSISAIFFVCPGLIEIQTLKLISPLLISNLYKTQDNNDNFFSLLCWDDLRYLQYCGHSIGNHSLFHNQFNELSLNKIKKDIYISKKLLKDNLSFNNSFDSFSFPFGGIKHINSSALKYLSKEFKYIFSGIRGDNNKNSNKMLFRDAVSLNDSFKITDSFLKGNFDIYYRLKLIKFALLK